MTVDEARSILLGGAGMGDLLHAVMTLANDQTSSISDLLLGLPHPELISEQAAFALYRRTGRSMPADGSQISTDPEDWMMWLLNNRNGDARESLRVLLATSAASAARIKPELASKLAAAIDQAAQ